MALFQDKIGRKSPGTKEKRNYRSIPFLPDAKQKSPKKQQKNSKNLKIALWLHIKPKLVGKGRDIERIKIIVPFHSYPTCN